MTSAGLLMFRFRAAGLQVLLAHPGGPFWTRRDDGAWTLPKGAVLAGEEPAAAARREFEEETGLKPDGPLLPLGEVRQRGGKRVLAWAIAGEFEPSQLRSNSFAIEWPPRSGKTAHYPEVDRVAWFAPAAARLKLLESQRPFIDRLESLVARAARGAADQAG